MQYFTYTYFDPSRQEFIYVGKGSRSRHLVHLRRTDTHPLTQRLQLMKRNGVEPKIGKIQHDSEQLALECELFLIQEIGRFPDGPLLNLLDGGQQGPTGLIHSEKTRRQMSMNAASKRPEVREKRRIDILKNHPMRSPEARAKVRAAWARRKALAVPK